MNSSLEIRNLLTRRGFLGRGAAALSAAALASLLAPDSARAAVPSLTGTRLLLPQFAPRVSG